MNARIKFSKYGVLKFVGHLDFMRYFQKAVRRAGIDVTYTEGFSPHQVMSFAMPLSLGATSDGEYMDTELNSNYEEQDILKLFNDVMSEGVEVTRFIKLPDWEMNKKKCTAMSLVSAADYKASFKTNAIIDANEFKKEFIAFMNKESILIQKKTKKGEAEIDIRPYIYEYSFLSDEFAKKTNRTTLQMKEAELHADEYNSTSVYLRLSAGSAVNIKPELVLKSFFECLNKQFNEHAVQIHRMELYKNADDGTNELIPLFSIF